MFTIKVPKPKVSETFTPVPKPLAQEVYIKVGKSKVSETFILVALETAPAAPYADVAEADYVIVDDSAVGPGNNVSE